VKRCHRVGEITLSSVGRSGESDQGDVVDVSRGVVLLVDCNLVDQQVLHWGLAVEAFAVAVELAQDVVLPQAHTQPKNSFNLSGWKFLLNLHRVVVQAVRRGEDVLVADQTAPTLKILVVRGLPCLVGDERHPGELSRTGGDPVRYPGTVRDGPALRRQQLEVVVTPDVVFALCDFAAVRTTHFRGLVIDKTAQVVFHLFDQVGRPGLYCQQVDKVLTPPDVDAVAGPGCSTESA
jgi:hypothetical protein